MKLCPAVSSGLAENHCSYCDDYLEIRNCLECCPLDINPQTYFSKTRVTNHLNYAFATPPVSDLHDIFPPIRFRIIFNDSLIYNASTTRKTWDRPSHEDIESIDDILRFQTRRGSSIWSICNSYIIITTICTEFLLIQEYTEICIFNISVCHLLWYCWVYTAILDRNSVDSCSYNISYYFLLIIFFNSTCSFSEKWKNTNVDRQDWKSLHSLLLTISETVIQCFSYFSHPSSTRRIFISSLLNCTCMCEILVSSFVIVIVSLSNVMWNASFRRVRWISAYSFSILSRDFQDIHLSISFYVIVDTDSKISSICKKNLLDLVMTISHRIYVK